MIKKTLLTATEIREWNTSLENPVIKRYVEYRNELDERLFQLYVKRVTELLKNKKLK